MIRIRKSEDRGHANYGWLDTKHTFSFNTYYDPANMGFRDLRVINEDKVRAGEGFGTHGHQDMEIISYVVGGALAHRDSTGGEEVLRRDEIQRMTAGTGIRHSEFNPSDSEDVHFLQIWILPEEQGLKPGYEQKAFEVEAKTNKLKLLVSKEGKEDSLRIHQDVSLYSSLLEKGNTVEHSFDQGRHGWLQVVSGNLDVNGNDVGAGDGVAISEEKDLVITATDDAEFLFFDLK